MVFYSSKRRLKKKQVLSAGFCQIEFKTHPKLGQTVDVKCHGKSESMNLESQPDIDAYIIRDLFSPLSQIKYLGLDVVGMYE